MLMAGEAQALRFDRPGTDPVFLQGLPSFAAHSPLHAALERYIADLDAAPFTTVDLGDAFLARGYEGPEVPVLRAGLAGLGYPAEPGPRGPAHFDRGLEAAVRLMQVDAGIPADGIVGSKTRRFLRDAKAILRRKAVQSLNVMPPARADRMIVVNIAAREVRYIVDGEVVFRERVAVGRPSRPTPPMAVTLTQITFNPIWSVPPGIESLDILPALARDSTYATRKGLRVYETVGRRWIPVDPLTVDWSTGPTHYSFLQPPGPANALGEVKFEMWNPQNIYLHDTPTRQQFLGDTRTDSSGCVRVRNIRDLARAVLGEELWLAENVEERLKGEQTFGVRLPRPIPVVLEYRLADFDAEGRLRFHPDIYDVLSPRPKAPIENDLNRIDRPDVPAVMVDAAPGIDQGPVPVAPEVPPVAIDAGPGDGDPVLPPVPEAPGVPAVAVDARPETGGAPIPAGHDEAPAVAVDAAPVVEQAPPDLPAREVPEVPAMAVDAAPVIEQAPPDLPVPDVQETPAVIVDAEPVVEQALPGPPIPESPDAPLTTVDAEPGIDRTPPAPPVTHVPEVPAVIVEAAPPVEQASPDPPAREVPDAPLVTVEVELVIDPGLPAPSIPHAPADAVPGTGEAPAGADAGPPPAGFMTEATFDELVRPEAGPSGGL